MPYRAPPNGVCSAGLEREGCAYLIFTSETQLHHGVLDLGQVSCPAFSARIRNTGRRMYDAVKAWLFQSNGKLMYLGGNGLNCEVELLADDRMIVQNTKISSLYPTGMGGAESRFARCHESEANLLGVVFDPRGIMTGAPYRVIEETHWIYAGTGLRTGDHFGEKSLHMRCPGGASGHETDKISPNSPQHLTLLAKGLNPDDGGAEMVVFDTPSGGGSVFAVGSICWPSCLPV